MSRGPHMYRTAQEAEWSYDHGAVGLHDLAEFRPIGREGGHLLTTVGRIIYNDRIERAVEASMGEDFDPSSVRVRQPLDEEEGHHASLVDDLVQKYGAATISQVLDAFKELGFQFATQAGVTVSKNDVQTPPAKAEILAQVTTSGLPRIDEQYDNGEMDAGGVATKRSSQLWNDGDR